MRRGERDEPGVEHEIGVERDDAAVAARARGERPAVDGGQPRLRAGGARRRRGVSRHRGASRRAGRPKPKLRNAALAQDRLCDLHELRVRGSVVLGGGRTAVEAVAPLAGRDRRRGERLATRALDGVGDDRDGPVGERRRAQAQRRLDLAGVVAVAAQHAPTEALELRAQVAEVADVRHPRVGLQLVVVDDDGQLAHAGVRRPRQGLPVLALLQLAIAGHDVEALVASQQPVLAAMWRVRTSGWPGRPPSRRSRCRSSSGSLPSPISAA